MIDNIMQTFKKFLEITQQEFSLFHNKTQDPKNIFWLKQKLLTLGWSPEFVSYHEKDDENSGMPFAELRNVILHINQYSNPIKTKINHQTIHMNQEDFKYRDTKYNQYISGNTSTYFRGNSSDPRQVNFSNIPPITIIYNGNTPEIVDG